MADLLEAIYTTGSVRYFRPDPIPDELVHKLVEAATRAPSGSNAQQWRFLVIKAFKPLIAAGAVRAAA